MDNDNLAIGLSAQIQISIELIGTVRKPSVMQIVFANRWDITPEKTQKTIQATTQKEIQTMLYPLLLRQFQTNDWNLCNYCLAHPVFSDKMFASTVFRRGNRCAQVHVTDFGWARAFPMASRSEVHETLLLLFAQDIVLPACISCNAKEMIQGNQKLNNAASQSKQLESYTPWSNAVESKIKDLKKGAGHKLLWSRAPKCLWDDCLVLEAYIRSITAHEINKLDGRVPKTVKSGKTFDLYGLYLTISIDFTMMWL